MKTFILHEKAVLLLNFICHRLTSYPSQKYSRNILILYSLINSKDVVTNAWNMVAKEIEFIENGKSIKVDFLNFLPGVENNSGTERFVLFSCKNNQEGRME